MDFKPRTDLDRVSREKESSAVRFVDEVEEVVFRFRSEYFTVDVKSGTVLQCAGLKVSEEDYGIVAVIGVLCIGTNICPSVFAGVRGPGGEFFVSRECVEGDVHEICVSTISILQGLALASQALRIFPPFVLSQHLRDSFIAAFHMAAIDPDLGNGVPGPVGIGNL